MTLNRRGADVRRTTRDKPGGGGIPCPECGANIDITIEHLLSRRAFGCPTSGCGVTLRLDTRRSTAALDTLKELKTKLDELGRTS